MKTVPMSEKLLSVICMVQSAMHLFLDEVNLVRYEADIEGQSYTKGMESKSDWKTRTRNYFFAIDDSLVNSVGLVKNEFCFEALLRYEVTEEMKHTHFDELGKFTFSY